MSDIFDNDFSPQISFTEFPLACTRPHTPLGMTSFFVYFLRLLFSSTASLGEPTLRNTEEPVVWRPDSRQTGIIIEAADVWNPAVANETPAVVVRRDSWHDERLALNDQVGVDCHGNEIYEVLVLGSHTIFVIANDEQTEIIGSEVAESFRQYAPILRRLCKFKRFAVAGVGGMGRLQEAESALTVPITISYAFAKTWVLSKQTPLFRDLNLLLESRTG